MKLRHQRGPEFIVHLAAQQKLHTFLNRRQDRVAIHSYSLAIALRGIFDVHCHIVAKSVLQNLLELLWERSVGVQLDPVAQILNFLHQARQIWMQQRLAAGDAYAV